MHDALEVRLATGRTPEQVVRLLEQEVAAARDLPPFVSAMLRHLLGHRLLTFQGKDSQANVLRGVRLIEEAAGADPEADVPAPPEHRPSAHGWVARELHTVASFGGPRYRRRLRDVWTHDAAEANLVAVPVAGDRTARIQVCLRLLDQAAQDEPLLVAHGHVTAGRAWAMRPDGDRTEHLGRSAEH